MTPTIEVFLLFARLGLVAFGAGTSVLAEMERESVQRGWIDHTQFVHAFALSQITPGPQMLLVAVVGYYAAGVEGALAASAGFFLPPGILTLLLASVWSRASSGGWPDAIRRALGPVAVGLMAAGVYAIAPAALAGIWPVLLFGAAMTWLLAMPDRSPLWVLGSGAAAGVILQSAGAL